MEKEVEELKAIEQQLTQELDAEQSARAELENEF